MKKIIKQCAVTVAAVGLQAGLVLGLAAPVNAASQDETTMVTHAKLAVGAPNAEASPASDPIIACGPHPADKDSSRWGRYFIGNYINMRRSPNPHATICAQGQKSHIVDYHCWTVGSDGYTWTYLRDATTHYAGWVRDNLLVGYGSLVHC
ncbi:MAG TPA: hypothetical protein VLI05_05540 [Candidatus Saccharimonadia bacterium]|nr:hypothetical protein [Candidatus Saccharimonadia bacterium]